VDLTVAKAVLLAMRSGAIKTDICELTQSLVPPHYVCNGYLFVRSRGVKTAF
jgi:hypothetical protein